MLFTRANGWSMRIKKTAVESKFGQMDQDMTDSGETEWQMDMEDLCMLRVMCMKESGPKTKPMDTEFTLILMEADMKVNGFKINNMVSVSSNGQMVPNTRVNTSKE